MRISVSDYYLVPFRSYRGIIGQILDEKRFRVPFAVHPRLIGKRIVDFLLVLIELFSLGVTAEAL